MVQSSLVAMAVKLCLAAPDEEDVSAVVSVLCSVFYQLEQPSWQNTEQRTEMPSETSSLSGAAKQSSTAIAHGRTYIE